MQRSLTTDSHETPPANRYRFLSYARLRGISLHS